MLKKAGRLIFVMLAIFFINISTAYGQEPNSADKDAIKKAEENLIITSGADKLYDNLPDDVRKLLGKSGLDKIEADTLINLSAWDFVKLVFSGIGDKIKEPIVILATSVGVVLLASLLGSLETNFNSTGLDNAFGITSVLCLSGIIVTPIIGILRQAAQLIEQASEFLLGFVPVYAGIITVSGKPLSAFAYNGMLVGVVELVSFISKNVLIPLCGIYLALCLTGAISTQINITGITRSIKVVTTWVLGLFMTIFVAILTIKSFVAGAADSVTMRTGKFLVGSFVPVIGGAISDAFTVLQGSIGVIKAAVGGFGILSVVLCFLPGIVSILLMTLAVKIAQIVSEMLSVKSLGSLLQATGFVLEFIQSILICYGVMIIISISLMLVMGLGT